MKLSLLGCISLLGLLVLPVVLGGWVDELGFSERDAGLISSASFLGAALAALGLAFRMHRLNLRRVAFSGLVGMALADGFSVLAADLPPLAVVAARFLSGVRSSRQRRRWNGRSSSRRRRCCACSATGCSSLRRWLSSPTSSASG